MTLESSLPRLNTLPLLQGIKNWTLYLCLAPAVVYDTVFFIGPLVFLVWIGFWTTVDYRAVPGFSLDNYIEIFSQLFSRSRYGLAIMQSIWVASTTTVIAVVFCYFLILAIIFGIPARFQRFVLLLAIAPFWSSYVLRLYSWQLVISRNGLVNSFLNWIGLGGLQLDITYTQTATRVGLVHYLSPLMIVILFIIVSNIDRDLIEAARDLGATQFQIFRRVILPLSQVGLAACASLGMIIGFGDVLSGNILGGGTGRSILGTVPLFSGMIMSDHASSTNLPRTSALATLLVGVMLGILVISFWVIDRAQKAVR
jgi:spermidine/putrescine transport system permease protein